MMEHEKSIPTLTRKKEKHISKEDSGSENVPLIEESSWKSEFFSTERKLL